MSFYIRKNGVTKKVSGLGSYSEGDGIDISGNNISVDTTFTEASTRTNISSGDTFATILGKIKKWFSDLPSMFVSKSGDTMSGSLKIDTGNYNDSVLEIGGTKSFGIIQFNNGIGTNGILGTDSLSSNRMYGLPDKSGTIALTSDIPSIVVKNVTFTHAGYSMYTDNSGGTIICQLGDTNTVAASFPPYTRFYTRNSSNVLALDTTDTNRTIKCMVLM